MSHIATIKMQIKNLDALEQACIALGLQFLRGQTVCQWEPGATRKCAHSIRLAGFKTYEIGVQQESNGDYSLIRAAYIPSQLRDLIGEDCLKLQDSYAAQISISQLRLEGYSVTSWTNEQGEIIVEATQ